LCSSAETYGRRLVCIGDTAADDHTFELSGLLDHDLRILVGDHDLAGSFIGRDGLALVASEVGADRFHSP
jgi:hypothetical protein